MAVLPSPFVKGWDGEDESEGKLWPVLPLDQAIAQQPGDAHALAYLVEGEEHIPRLSKRGLAKVLSSGVKVMVHWVFLDIDNPGHKPWKKKKHARQAIEDLRRRAPGITETAGIFATRAGMRVVYRLANPIPAATAKATLTAVARWFEDATGERVDPEATGHWWRCFRLPRVVRDGKKTKGYMDMRPLLKGASLTWSDEIPTIDDMDQPESPGEVTEAQWETIARRCSKARQYVEKMRLGLPLARVGSRDTTMIGVLASLAAGLKETDPRILYRYLYASVASDQSDGAPTLAKLWDRCCYYAELEIRKIGQAKAVLPTMAHTRRETFILDTAEGEYRGPFGSDAICLALERYAKGTGLETLYRSSAGQPRDRASYLADLNSYEIGQIVYSMATEKARLDVATSTMVLPACVPLDVPAEEWPEVGRWLDLLGGRSASLLLDWLATVGRLDRPTCALYIRGPDSVGKGLLVSALARLWGHDVTDYQDAVGSFNASLLKCPIVWADEAMPYDPRGAGTADFRRLVGNDKHRINAKYQDVTTMRGCVRLVITANNDDALRVMNEQLTEQDIAAVAKRIAYIATDDRAREYLEGLGGREGTSDWVDGPDGPGKVCRHIRWLGQTRKVDTSGRFLVSGQLGSFHRKLGWTSGINLAILEALATWAKSGEKVDGLQITNGAFVVNATQMGRIWSRFSMELKKPGTREIANALGSISHRVVRARCGALGQVRCHEIPGDAVLWAMDELQMDGIDRVKAALKGKKVKNKAGNRG